MSKYPIELTERGESRIFLLTADFVCFGAIPWKLVKPSEDVTAVREMMFFLYTCVSEQRGLRLLQAFS